MSLKDNLRKTRALLTNPFDWIQGVSIKDRDNGSKSYCLMGAAWAACENGDRDDCYDEVKRALSAVTPKSYESPIAFNDAVGRQHGEILELLDEAIAAA